MAVFDARLPGGSGIDACRHVRSVDRTIKGLVLTSYDDEHALTTAVLAGASGFLLKDVRSNGLVDVIRRIAAGANLLDTEQARRLVETWRVHEDADPRLRVLTPQKRRVLEHIAAGLTNRQIGEEMSWPRRR